MAALRGEMTMAEAVETVKRESRRYAKRQLTWFRRNPEIRWIYQTEPVDFAKTWQEAEKIMNN